MTDNEMGVHADKTIIVIVEGGTVQEVRGVPAEWRLEVRDYDIEDAGRYGFEEDEYGRLYRAYIWEAQS